MYELRIEDTFAAAHYLRDYEGKCENLHGHNWKVEVMLRGEKLGKGGMLVDFKTAREILSDVLGRFDHKYLNEVKEFEKVNPTTENLARILYEAIGARLPGGVSVSRVTCWESDRCGASYFEG